MKKNIIFFLIAMAVFVLSTYLLVTSSPALTYALGKEDSIPLGSFITWAGLIALPMALYWGVGKLQSPGIGIYRVLALTVKALIVLAVLWLPISYLLAGNMNFNFGEVDTFQGGQTAMQLFWMLSLGIPLATIILFILYLLLQLFRAFK